MLNYLYKKLKFIELKKQADYNKTENKKIPSPKLSSDLEENMAHFRRILGDSPDIIYRELRIGSKMQIKAALIFLDGIAKKDVIDKHVLKPLLNDTRLHRMENEFEFQTLDIIKEGILSAESIRQTVFINKSIDECLSGNTIFLMDGCNKALIIHSTDWKSRNIEEPKTEVTVRGPREGFSESILINISLLRHKIKNPNLTFETMQIGTQTRTSICISYIKGIANKKLVKEVKQRLSKIHTDAILESGYIEQFIEDEPYSIFPTVGNCEKPDTAAAKILEGRVAILVDGTPFVLTVPMLFIEGFQSGEDYYSRPFLSSLIRILRILSFLITILTPAAYVMLSTFHQELIPTKLLFTMAADHEGVPFPAVMEAFLMLITFEILREAGVRLPRPVGQAVSIIGALVLGEAAVSAGLVGGLMIIVVSITAISSFVIPTFTDVTSILRIVFLILAGSLGIFGIGMGSLVVLIHVVSLNSFGTPYFYPFAPFDKTDLKDTFIRTFLWKMITRPKLIKPENTKREASDLKPTPPRQDKSSN
ncbi:spore germination protein [Clostridium sp.]|jgi:spore germination protein KA|uniref:spore germination protein n=1 Tax=Clostridium sp. TaxID=1506 RepID=UPI003A5C1F5B